MDLAELWTIGRQNATAIDYIRSIFTSANIDNRLDDETLAYMILKDCGNMQPLYNDTAAFHTFAIMWARSRKEQINHLLSALFTTYDPYEEFRWSEHEVLDGTLKIDDIRDIDDKRKVENEGSFNNIEHTESAETNSVSADNESDFQPREKRETVVDSTLDNVHADVTQDNDKVNDTLDGTHKTDNITDRTFYGHKKSSQLLALEEFELAKHNVYDMLVQWFTDSLLLGVYE